MNLLMKVEENNSILNLSGNNIEIEIDIFSLDNDLIGEYNRQWPHRLPDTCGRKAPSFPPLFLRRFEYLKYRNRLPVRLRKRR